MNRVVKYESYNLTSLKEIQDALDQVASILKNPNGRVSLTVVLEIKENA